MRTRTVWIGGGVLFLFVNLGLVLAGLSFGFWVFGERSPRPPIVERYPEVTSPSTFLPLTPEQAEACEAEGGALVPSVRPHQVYCFPARREAASAAP